jgi:hypothetical protein
MPEYPSFFWPVRVWQGNARREVSYKLLEMLTDAYRAVASGKIGG